MSAKTKITAHFPGILSGIKFLDADGHRIAKIDFPNTSAGSAKLEFGGGVREIVRERRNTGNPVPDVAYRVVSETGTLAAVEIRIPPSGSVRSAKTLLTTPEVLVLKPTSGFFRRSADVTDAEGAVVGSLYEPSFFSLSRRIVIDLPASVSPEARFLLAYVIINRDFYASSSVPY